MRDDSDVLFLLSDSKKQIADVIAEYDDEFRCTDV
jgi:hypothetical protein